VASIKQNLFSAVSGRLDGVEFAMTRGGDRREASETASSVGSAGSG
jgi:hypothetical protein